MPIPDDKDLWRSAGALVKQRGKKAEGYATRRADELGEAGDQAGKVVWLGILKCIRTLHDQEAKRAVH